MTKQHVMFCHLNSVLFNFFSVWIPKSIINPFTNYDVSGKVFSIFGRRVTSCLRSNLLRILTSNKVLKSSSFGLLFLPTDIGRKLHQQCAMVDSDGVKGKNYEINNVIARDSMRQDIFLTRVNAYDVLSCASIPDVPRSRPHLILQEK